MSTVSSPSLLRRVWRRFIAITLTLVVLAGAGAAVNFGSDELARRAEAVPAPNPADLLPVATRSLVLDDGYTVQRRFVGQVESGATVALSFELGGRLVDLLVDEGDQVSKGQLIAQLDTDLIDADAKRLIASRNATQSQLDFAETRVVRAQALRGEGFASQEALDQALSTRDELISRIAEINASLAAVRINLEKSSLYAPFDGQIGAQAVDGGETLAAGQAVVTLLKTGTPEVRVGLPLSITPDMLADVQIEIEGIVGSARLIQLRPDIDPVTRTRTALFEVEAAQAVFGQTATLLFDTQIAAQGAWVPIDALRESAGGIWTVLVVEDGIVRQAAVEILHAEQARAFVRGSFENGAEMVRTGAHRVVPGQSVVIANAEG